MPKIFFSWMFWFLAVHLALVSFFLYTSREYFWRIIKKLDRKVLLVLFFIFIYGFMMRNSGYWLGPTTDSYVYSESAFFWVEEGRQVKSCALGNHENCQLYEEVLFPPGFPFLISLSMLIFGNHSLNAPIISAILSSFSVILIFFISRIFFKNDFVALCSSLVYALLPLNIIYSATGLARPSGIFFSGLALLLYLSAKENNKKENWLALIFSLSFSIYVRPENFILAILLFAHYSISERRVIRSKLKSFFSLSVIFLLLQLPFLIVYNPVHTLKFLLNENVSRSVLPQISPNWINEAFLYLKHFFNDGGLVFHYNIFASIALFAAMVFIAVRRREYSLLIFLFLGYLAVLSLANDASAVDASRLTQSYFRRSLLLHLPFSLLAGYGMFLFFPRKDRIINIFLALFLLISLNPVIWDMKRISNRDTIIKRERSVQWFNENLCFYWPQKVFQANAAEKNQYNFIVNPDQDYWMVLEKIPENCMLLTSVHLLPQTDYFADKKFRVASLELIHPKRESLFLEEFKKQTCLYYLEDKDKTQENEYFHNFLSANFIKSYEYGIGEVSVFKLVLK